MFIVAGLMVMLHTLQNNGVCSWKTEGGSGVITWTLRLHCKNVTILGGGGRKTLIVIRKIIAATLVSVKMS